MMKENRLREQYNRLLTYVIARGDRRGIRRHGNLHMKGHGNVWYVFPYRKAETVKGRDDPDSKRTRAFWKFMDGDRRFYPCFYSVYLRAVRQVLWIAKAAGSFEIAAIPKSDHDAPNPIATVCSEIALKERFILGRAIDGTDLLKRTRKIRPVHKGGMYTETELEATMEVTRPLKAGTVVLADDLVFTGKSIEACKTLLKQAGAKRVYAICLYGYRQ